MQVQSLAEIELRDAIQPLNRSAPSNFGPALRTPALIRELVALGVVDASLSKVLVLSGKVLGGCLVERVPGGGLLSALSIEPLAQHTDENIYYSTKIMEFMAVGLVLNVNRFRHR